MIAGRSDCPYYAKSELLADKLATNLQSFSIHKETVRADAWSAWLKENCEAHGFNWSSSPIIWRELTERGGRGALLGGYNEFCEYAKLYYNQEYEISSTLAKDIAEENKLITIKTENEVRRNLDKRKPLNIAFTNPQSSLAYQLIPAMLKRGAVFEDELVKDGIQFNAVGDCNDSVKGMLMELEDLAEPLLAAAEMHSSLEVVVKNTDFLLILDDNDKHDHETRIEWINRNREKYSEYGKVLKGFKGRIFIAGEFASIGAYLLMKASETLTTEQILITATVNENAGKGCISRKLGLNASKIHHVLYYGSTVDDVETALFSTHATTVQGIESAIYGFESYHRALDEVLFNNEWKLNEFDSERRKNRPRPAAKCAAIVKVFKEWFAENPTGHIMSCGVHPDPSTTLTSSYICLPGTFQNKIFVPLEITLSENEKVKLNEVDRINNRCEQIATLSHEEQAAFAEDEATHKQHAEVEIQLDKEMSGNVEVILEEEEEGA